MTTKTLDPPADMALVDPDLLSDVEIAPTLVELRREISRLEAASASLVAAAERRGIPASEGFGSTTGWLIAHTGDQPGVCSSRVRTARALPQMPLTRQVFSSGELPEGRVRVLVRAHDTAPETFQRDEGLLVEQALTLHARAFPRAVQHWCRLADQDRFREDHEAMFEARALYVSRTWGGMTRIDGNLDPETGHVILTALEAICAPGNLDPTDTRTPTQRRADGLGEICRRYLDHGDTPIIGGERPHINVVVGLEVLEGRAGRRCELEGDGEITPEAARRLACDAEVTRIVTRAESQPLDVGRATRTVPAGMRRALALRDGGCVHPGCTVPPQWCDVHHRNHWADGGDTKLENLELRCRRHHTHTHKHDNYPKRQ